MKRIPLLALCSAMLCFPLTRAYSQKGLAGPVLEFAGSYLLGKAADAVWDTATGKPDIKQLQERIERLEQLLGDASGPIEKLREEITPATTEAAYASKAADAINELQTELSANPGALSHIYVGGVGRLKAVFSLTWASSGKVTGVYCNPTRDATQIYELAGSNPSDGKLLLNEYTKGRQTASLSLSKKLAPGWIIWEGKMHNTDGRTLDVTFQRER